MNQNIDRQEQDRPTYPIADDEIDLVQLLQILLKRKYLILGVLFFCLLGGGGYSLQKGTIYEYNTTIQIGTVLASDSNMATKTWIEDSSNVKLKLEKVYVPMAVNQLSARHEGRIASATVKENKNSNILLIASKGSLDDGKFYKNFHTIAINPLIENHRELIAASKKQYEIFAQRAKLTLKDLEDPKIYSIAENTIKGRIESAQLDLVGIDDQKKILLAKKSGLTKTKKLLHPQINQIEKNLKISYAKRDQVISEVKDEAKAMTFLMLNSDIQQNENRLATLRERLDVNLENENQKIEGQLAENLRHRKSQMTQIDELKSKFIQLQAQRSSAQDKQRSKISEAENNINFYQDTKVLEVAARSIKSVGPRKSLILALSGMLGLMGGIILVFFAEFMTKVRHQQKIQDVKVNT